MAALRFHGKDFFRVWRLRPADETFLEGVGEDDKTKKEESRNYCPLVSG